MTTIAAKDVYVTWSGEASHWGDYVRKVRLQWEKTPDYKKRHLAPELASRLTDKAWQALYDIDHARLSKRSGTKYLLAFLRDKLCQAPVPDAGARLEDLLIRLRRTPGTPFAQWAHEVRDSYRRLQRALLRARKDTEDRLGPPRKPGSTLGSRATPSEPEVRPEPVSPSARSARSQRSQHSAQQGTTTARPEAAPATAETAPAVASVPQDGEPADDQWTEEEWRAWNEWYARSSADDRYSSYDPFEDDPDAGIPWDELELGESEVLPEEVLGWILLRRAGLPVSSRLSVQASVGNSLRFDDIERALRDQEEELLAAERRPHERRFGKGGGPPKRTFWVEEDKQWGLLDLQPDDDEDLPIHWIGEQLPEEVYSVQMSSEAATDHDEGWWQGGSGWEDGSWASPTWWSEDWSPDAEFTPDEVSQMEEAYAAYDDKVRTFVQARQVMKHKAQSRGFFPTVKGKFQKGKGKPKGKAKGTPVLAASSVSSGSGKQRPGQPEYTGCFICGAKDHSFQQCPKRKGKGSAHYVSDDFYVEEVVDDTAFDDDQAKVNEVFMVVSETECVAEEIHTWAALGVDRCYAVIDSGATETVASLTALQEIMNKRQAKYGREDVEVFEGTKTFRFGNGKALQSSSYVEIPQTVGGVVTRLGVYTLDTGDQFVPLLIGMKTLERLHAVVDFRSKEAVFRTISDQTVRLQECPRTNHCLLDLSSDWIDSAHDVIYMDSLVASSSPLSSPSPTCLTAEPADLQAQLQPSELERENPSDPCHGPEQGVHAECDSFGMQHSGSGQRISQTEEEAGARRGGVRLQSEGRTKCSRSSLQGRALREDGACGRTNGQRLPFGQECLGHVADMPTMSPTLGIHPSIWRARPLSVGWTIGGRCDCDPSGEIQRSGCESQGARHHQCGPRWSGEIFDETAGEGAEAKGSASTAHWPGDSWDKEDGQARSGLDSGGIGGIQSTDGGVLGGGEEVSTPEGVRLLIAESMIGTTTAMAEAEKEFNDAMSLCFSCTGPESAQLDLIEVCCPPGSSLSAKVEQMGGRAVRVTEKNMNLNTVTGMEQTISLVRTERPRWLWISLPCGASSPIQGLNELDEESWRKSQERKRRSRKLIRRAINVLRVHVFENGGEFGWEWPDNNFAWQWKEVLDFMKEVHEKKGIYKTILHGCQVGVKNADGQPVKKPWRIHTTDRDMAAVLNLMCPGGHQHAPCLGGQTAKMSGFYPPRMVSLISRQIMKKLPTQTSLPAEDFSYALEDADEPVPDGISATDWKKVKDVVFRLHVRAGHPSRAALTKSLQARGAHPFVILASKHISCDDCAETKKASPGSKASFSRSDVLWHTLQIDNAQFKVGKKTYNVMVLVDEASSFVVPHFLAELDEDEHQNATAEDVVNGLQESWIRFFGHPSRIRLDPEGAFRSRALEEFCASRDIELEPCPAEFHQHIGVVERTIGTLRKSLESFLRSEPDHPWSAIMSMCSAHNEMARIAGFSPNQWALGRSFDLDGKLHESNRDATPFFNSQRDPENSLHHSMILRLKAEEHYKRMLAQEAINRSWNSKSKPGGFFVPGTMVYYKRFKPPSTSPVSHAEVDVTRRRIARWFGPARVLATESRVEIGTGRPSHVIWITAAGRLKLLNNFVSQANVRRF